MNLIIKQKPNLNISEDVYVAMRYFDFYFPIRNSNEENKEILLNDFKKELKNIKGANKNVDYTLKEGSIYATKQVNVKDPLSESKPILLFAGILTDKSKKQTICIHRIYDNGRFKTIVRPLVTRNFTLSDLNLPANSSKPEDFFVNEIDTRNVKKLSDEYKEKSEKLNKQIEKLKKSSSPIQPKVGTDTETAAPALPSNEITPSPEEKAKTPEEIEKEQEKIKKLEARSRMMNSFSKYFEEND